MSEQHKPRLEVRDPVHGFVKLSQAEWRVVDCPTFQRLRDIRQLAMAHLVYPGATHTRFEHSLGCLHLSSCVYDAIEEQVGAKKCPNFAEAFRADNEQLERGRHILRLAALLHDVGHSPFSHAGESLMPEGVDHEEMSARLIRKTEIAGEIARGYKDLGIELEEVIAVATGPKHTTDPNRFDRDWYRFLNEILTGELGSDRMDYLLRDAAHSGQGSGHFDHRKLIDSMVIVPPPEETGERFRLGLDEAGWLVSEQMVIARYLMYVSLYFHKTKRILETHLEEFLAAWLEKETGEPKLPTSDLDKYRALTDSRVWAEIYASEGTDLGEFAAPFVSRRHFRLASELLLADNRRRSRVNEPPGQSVVGSEGLENGPPGQGFEFADAWNTERFDKLKEDVRLEFGSGPVRFDVTTHRAHKFFGARDKIWVLLDGKTRYLDDLSEIVRGMPARIWRGRVYSAISIRGDVKGFCDKWLRGNPSH